MNIKAGQWWETRNGELVHVRYVSPESIDYCIYGILRHRGSLDGEMWGRNGFYWGNTTASNNLDLVKHLPECTGWDWEPPKPVDPGEGWRLIEAGEAYQQNDEAMRQDGTWAKFPLSWFSPVRLATHIPVRRSVQTDVPADWQLIGGILGGMLYFKPTDAT